MNTQIKYIFIVLIGLLIASCTSDEVCEPVPNQEEKRSYILNLEIPNQQVLSTRSEDKIVLSEDDMHFWVFATNQYQFKSESITPLGSNKFEIIFEDIIPADAMLIVVANGGDLTVEPNDEESYEDFMKRYTCGMEGLKELDKTPLWSTYHVSREGLPSSIDLELKRSVAQVDVGLAPDLKDYTIEGVYMYHPSTFYLGEYLHSEPTTSSWLFSPVDPVSFYVGGIPLNEGKQEARVVVEIKKDSGESGFFGINFENMKDDSTGDVINDPLPVVQNTIYSFVIRGFEREGWETAEDACLYGSPEDLDYKLDLDSLDSSYEGVWIHNGKYFALAKEWVEIYDQVDAEFVHDTVGVNTNFAIDELKFELQAVYTKDGTQKPFRSLLNEQKANNQDSFFQFDFAEEKDHVILKVTPQTNKLDYGEKYVYAIKTTKGTLIKEITLEPTEYQIYEITNLDMDLKGQYVSNKKVNSGGKANEFIHLKVTYNSDEDRTITLSTRTDEYPDGYNGLIFEGDLQLTKGEGLTTEVKMYPIKGYDTPITVRDSKNVDLLKVNMGFKFPRVKKSSIYQGGQIGVPILPHADYFRKSKVLLVSQDIARWESLYILLESDNNFATGFKDSYDHSELNDDKIRTFDGVQIESMSIDIKDEIPKDAADKYHVIFFLDDEKTDGTANYKIPYGTVQKFVQSGGVFIQNYFLTDENTAQNINNALGHDFINSIDVCLDLYDLSKQVMRTIDREVERCKKLIPELEAKIPLLEAKIEELKDERKGLDTLDFLGKNRIDKEIENLKKEIGDIQKEIKSCKSTIKYYPLINTMVIEPFFSDLFQGVTNWTENILRRGWEYIYGVGGNATPPTFLYDTNKKLNFIREIGKQSYHLQTNTVDEQNAIAYNTWHINKPKAMNFWDVISLRQILQFLDDPASLNVIEALRPLWVSDSDVGTGYEFVIVQDPKTGYIFNGIPTVFFDSILKLEKETNRPANENARFAKYLMHKAFKFAGEQADFNRLNKISYYSYEEKQLYVSY